MTDQLRQEQTAFGNLILNATQKGGIDIKPTLGPTDAVAVQSDIAAVTAGTTINPATGILSSWKATENPVFVSTSVITLDRTGIDSLAVPGVPIRYSNDGATWKYGLIRGRVTNPSTMNLTIAGVAFNNSPSNINFVEVGTDKQVVKRQIHIAGALVNGDDQIDSVLNDEVLWYHSEAFLVFATCKVKTAGSGSNVLVNIAHGSAGNNISLSDIDLAQASTRVDTGVDIDDTNYKIDFEDKLFVNVDDAGSTTPAENLTITLVYVFNTEQVQTFVPLAAPTPPLAFQMGGNTSPSSWTVSSGFIDSLEYFSMSVSVGSGADRGDDTVQRGNSLAVFDSTRTFNVGGRQSTGAITSAMTFIDTPSISGNAVARGDLPTNLSGAVGVSGATHGFSMGGLISSSSTNNINTILLPTATGDGADRGDLPVSTRFASGGYNNEKGLCCGGVLSFTQNNIQELNISTTVGNAVDGGDLVTTIAYPASISDVDNDEVYVCGGTTNSSTVSGGQTDTIQTIDLTTFGANAVDRDDLSRITGSPSANSGDTIGYISGGGTSSPAAVIGAIDKFTYTTGTIVVSNRGSMLVPKHTTRGHM